MFLASKKQNEKNLKKKTCQIFRNAENQNRM